MILFIFNVLFVCFAAGAALWFLSRIPSEIRGYRDGWFIGWLIAATIVCFGLAFTTTMALITGEIPL